MTKSALVEPRYNKLLDDLEDSSLAMARGGTGEQCTNSLNGLAATTNDAADVSPSELQLKNGRSAARNFREDHIVRKFDQLPNNELEKLSHAPERLTTNPVCTIATEGHVNANKHEFCSFDALERPLSLADHANIARAKRPLLNQLAANRRVHSETATLPGSVVSFLAPLAITAQWSLLLS